MTDGLDVVAVGVAHEPAVVVRVVLGPDARLVQHLGALRDRGRDEGAHRGAVGRDERDVRLAIRDPSESGPIQNVGLLPTPYPITAPKSMMRAAAERRERRVVETRRSRRRRRTGWRGDRACRHAIGAAGVRPPAVPRHELVDERCVGGNGNDLGEGVGHARGRRAHLSRTAAKISARSSPGSQLRISSSWADRLVVPRGLLTGRGRDVPGVHRDLADVAEQRHRAGVGRPRQHDRALERGVVAPRGLGVRGGGHPGREPRVVGHDRLRSLPTLIGSVSRPIAAIRGRTPTRWPSKSRTVYSVHGVGRRAGRAGWRR